ncbi:UNVERIFIED_ORG: hypothetical protein FHR35_009175 [Microbispora rosea subsp. rosea]
MTTTARDVLAAAANRIERSTWASRHQQPGVTLSDAIALEVRDAPGTDAQRASLQDAAFEALRCHVAPSAADINDWLRDPDRTQAEVVAALRGAATATSDHEDEGAAHQERFWGPGGHLQTEVPPDTRLVVNGEHQPLVPGHRARPVPPPLPRQRPIRSAQRGRHTRSVSISGYITRDEIKEVIGLLLVRPDQEDPPTAYVNAVAINGEHENPIGLTRAYLEVQDVLAEATRDAEHYGGTLEAHMPNRPEVFGVEYDDDGDGSTVLYIGIETYDESLDRKVAMDIMRAIAARFSLTAEERNSL